MNIRLGNALAAVAVTAFFCMASTTDAGLLVVGSKIKLATTGYPGSNGEFGVFVNNGASYTNSSYANPTKPNEDFRTFCAEKYENFNPGQEMTVSGISLVTVATGYSLTNAAAWLFREFSLLKGAGYIGSIGGTSYNSNDSDANALQNALWFYIGGQIGGLTGANNKYVNAVNANQSAINAMQSYGGVRILNLKVGAQNKQDQLYYDADSDPDRSLATVPEPMSAAVWLTALAGAVLMRRKRQRVA